MRVYKLYIYAILLFIVSCNNEKYSVKQQYVVMGTKTAPIRVNYSDQDGITTVVIDPSKLPWTNTVELEGIKHRHKDWFLSADSSSAGDLAVVIGSEEFVLLNLNSVKEIASNYTTGSYVQVILKSGR